MNTKYGLFFILAWISCARTIRGLPIEDDWQREALKNTADRVKEHGYPGEVHQLETEDNYIVTMFRIPYSHNLQNQNEKRPAILLQHGLTSCSDAWILSGPNDAIAFQLVEAGYDVWMGNARGNTYSRNNTRLSPGHPYFWRFSWHEIAIYDISAMIDYILETTDETAIHYTGHSQGTTVFFVLMAERPEYNAKIKTAHMLAPVAFMSNMTTLLAKYTRRFIGRPNELTKILDTMEVMQSDFISNIYKIFCFSNPALEYMCSNLAFIIGGDSEPGNMNQTVSQELSETHPAGASSTQVLHYMQEYESGRFCQLDHGVKENLKRYGRETPPDYDVGQITANLYFYYADADTLADVKDIEYLASILPTPPHMYHVPDPTFTHADFNWHINVKELIVNPIIDACNSYEKSIQSVI